MGYDTVVQVFREALIQTLLIASPVLFVGAAVGFLLSIFQATTSLQDQTLTFVPKIFAIFGSLAYFGPWMMSSLTDFTIALYRMIPSLS